MINNIDLNKQPLLRSYFSKFNFPVVSLTQLFQIMKIWCVKGDHRLWRSTLTSIVHCTGGWLVSKGQSIGRDICSSSSPSPFPPRLHQTPPSTSAPTACPPWPARTNRWMLLKTSWSWMWRTSCSQSWPALQRSTQSSKTSSGKRKEQKSYFISFKIDRESFYKNYFILLQ